MKSHHQVKRKSNHTTIQISPVAKDKVSRTHFRKGTKFIVDSFAAWYVHTLNFMDLFHRPSVLYAMAVLHDDTIIMM